MFASLGPETLSIFIPILMVLGGVLIAITAVIIKGRNKDLEHRERIIAMEKGLPLPEPVMEIRRPVYSGRRAAGLVIFGVGLALTIALWAVEGHHGGLWGLIPLFIGAGLLIAAVLDKKEYEQAKAEEKEEAARSQPPTHTPGE